MRKITYKKYLDKAFGCWLGKSIGGACGALSENNKAILHYTLENVFPKQIPPNDDLDLQVLWLVELLEKKGTALTSNDFAEAFAAHNICLANEYAVAIKNIECGIMPPVSGIFSNDFFKNSMGCPIRSEIWAVVAPGSPETSKSYAMADGSIDHDLPAVYSEVFNAVMESEAFFESDIKKLIKKGLSHIPAHCVIYDVAEFVLHLYESGLSWETARNRFVKKYGSQDASYAQTNCGLTLLALLYGEKDYTKTLLYSVNGGFDTDCTAATALSVLGIITGAEKTPVFWLNKIGTDLVIGTIDIDCPYKTIASFAEASVKAGLSFFEEGLLDIEITDIPEEICGSLPKSEYPEVSIIVDYEGAPSIAIGESRAVTISVLNNSEKEITGTLRITPAKALTYHGSPIEMTLAPEMSFSTTAVFTVKEAVLPMENICKVTFGKEKGYFGFMGAMQMKMIGPFFDHFDTTVYDHDPFHEITQRFPNGAPDLKAMFGGFVNINRAYIDESFVDLDAILADETSTETVNIHGDVFDIEEKVSYIGPACVYLVYDFYAEEDAVGSHHFGSNAPFKVWENGNLICDCQTYGSMTPFDMNPGMNIHKGFNRMIFKLTRNEAFRFSWSMRNAYNRAKYFHKTKSPAKE